MTSMSEVSDEGREQYEEWLDRQPRGSTWWDMTPVDDLGREFDSTLRVKAFQPTRGLAFVSACKQLDFTHPRLAYSDIVPVDEALDMEGRPLR